MNQVCEDLICESYYSGVYNTLKIEHEGMLQMSTNMQQQIIEWCIDNVMELLLSKGESINQSINQK